MYFPSPFIFPVSTRGRPGTRLSPAVPPPIQSRRSAHAFQMPRAADVPADPRKARQDRTTFHPVFHETPPHEKLRVRNRYSASAEYVSSCCTRESFPPQTRRYSYPTSLHCEKPSSSPARYWPRSAGRVPSNHKEGRNRRTLQKKICPAWATHFSQLQRYPTKRERRLSSLREVLSLIRSQWRAGSTRPDIPRKAQRG